ALNLQEHDKCDAVAEPGRGVPHARKLRLLELLDDLLNGCLSVRYVFLVELGPNHQNVHRPVSFRAGRPLLGRRTSARPGDSPARARAWAWAGWWGWGGVGGRDRAGGGRGRGGGGPGVGGGGPGPEGGRGLAEGCPRRGGRNRRSGVEVASSSARWYAARASSSRPRRRSSSPRVE